MPRRTGIGARAPIAVLLAVLVVVAAAAYFSYTNPGGPASIISSTRSTSQSTCTSPPGKAGNATVAITETAGQWPPCSCALVDSNSNGTLYVSTNAVVGDDVCIAASMTESPIVSFEVIGPAGVYLSTPGCMNSAFTAVSCEADWDTAQPDPRGNPIQPGSYELIASDGEGSRAVLEANFTLTSNTAVATTTTTESNGTLLASRTWESWSFEVSMNSTSVRTGGAISLSDRLTYLGSANETIDMVSPILSASVYNSTGAQVWQFTPSQITTSVTVYSGETFGQPLCIPTAVLTPTEQNQTQCFFNFIEQPAPGVYSVVAQPLFYLSNGQDLGQNLQISLSFTITT